MYMRLMGHPAEKITILTTYNGQKHLIRDVVAQRCGDNPLIGKETYSQIYPLRLVTRASHRNPECELTLP